MRQIKIILLLNAVVLLLMGTYVFGECWVVSGFHGYAGNVADDFTIHKDSLSGQTFNLNIDSDKSTVSGSKEISFTEVTPQLIVGIYRSGTNKGVVESWGVDIKNRMAFYTQTKSGYTIFDGAKMFIGKVEGKCK